MDKNNNIQQHYDQLLARQYTWVFGDVQSKVEENKILFQSLGLGNGAGALAVDLGSGPGYHSLALSKLGYEVVAVDTSKVLLNELVSHDDGKRIKTVHADIRKIRDIAGCQANLVICMGDTISLLDSYSDLTELLKDIRQCLSEKGRFILSFGDQTRALEGSDRILPIKNERDRVFTCLLEYEKDKIGVTDFLYQFVDGKWILDKSSYKKIRIFSEKMEAIICEMKIPSHYCTCVENIGYVQGGRVYERILEEIIKKALPDSKINKPSPIFEVKRGNKRGGFSCRIQSV